MAGDTVTGTVTAVEERVVEGLELQTAVRIHAARVAGVKKGALPIVNVTDNDSATVTLSDTADVEEGGATDTLTVTLTLQTSGSGPVALATDIKDRKSVV